MERRDRYENYYAILMISFRLWSDKPALTHGPWLLIAPCYKKEVSLLAWATFLTISPSLLWLPLVTRSKQPRWMLQCTSISMGTESSQLDLSLYSVPWPNIYNILLSLTFPFPVIWVRIQRIVYSTPAYLSLVSIGYQIKQNYWPICNESLFIYLTWQVKVKCKVQASWERFGQASPSCHPCRFSASPWNCSGKNV